METPSELALAVLGSVAAGIRTPVTIAIAARGFDMETLTGTGHGVRQRISQAVRFGWYAVFATRLLRMTAVAPTPVPPASPTGR
ncbi:hypothetical protein AB0M79_34370 [Polymorphospora sp. NPDC051019]|uniref:hypothetical protein n=1 Tax=Polymorphospora sp. NPDC051019 TaxID=3155725 RepID=UPI0034465D46